MHVNNDSADASSSLQISCVFGLIFALFAADWFSDEIELVVEASKEEAKVQPVRGGPEECAKCAFIALAVIS